MRPLRELRRLLQHSCRVDGGSSRTSVSIHGFGYLLTALRRQRLIPDELVLQLATFLHSHDLFLELRARTPRTLTANQARGGKQGTDGRERSRIHFRCLALNFTAAEPPAQRLTTSLTSRSFLERTAVPRAAGEASDFARGSMTRARLRSVILSLGQRFAAARYVSSATR